MLIWNRGGVSLIILKIRGFMSTVNVLKITCNENIVLLSTRITQTISPLSEYKIMRNINNQVIKQSNAEQSNFDQSLRCIIKTINMPNTEYLKIGEKYKIYSIIEFCSSTMPVSEYVPNSLIKVSIGYKYRPVLNAMLTYFECSTNHDITTWTMTFDN